MLIGIKTNLDSLYEKISSYSQRSGSDTEGGLIKGRVDSVRSSSYWDCYTEIDIRKKVRYRISRHQYNKQVKVNT